MPSDLEAAWLVLLTLAYAIHFAEEMWIGGGYPAYLYRLRGVRLPTRRFVLFQALGFALLITGAVLSVDLKFSQMMVLIVSAVYASNGLSHTATAIWDRHYGPGLWASIFLWLPIGSYGIVRLSSSMPAGRAALAISIGLLISFSIAIITLVSGKRERRAAEGPPLEAPEDAAL